MWNFLNKNKELVYKPKWANSLLAYNSNFRKCSYAPCERIINDGEWFKVVKENSHFLTFHSEYCETAYDRKYRAQPE